MELRSVHQFNNSIYNFVLRAVPSEKDSASRALKCPDDDPTEQIDALQSVMKPTGSTMGPRRTVRSCFQFK